MRILDTGYWILVAGCRTRRRSRESRATSHEHRASNIVLALLLCTSAIAEDALSPFDQLLNKVRASEDATEQDARKLLHQAREMGRPFAAQQAIKSYLKNQVSPTADLLLLAAKNAERMGDFRSAVARYKTWLANAAPGKNSSDVAARMYEILIDFIHSSEDAYQFMLRDGLKFRQSVNARKFDHWFLKENYRRKKYVLFADRLLVSLKSSSAIERELLWGYVRQLQKSLLDIRHDREEKFAALPSLKAIHPLIKDPKLRDYFGLCVANLDYHSRRPGSDSEKAVKLFAPVVQQAKSLFDRTPNRETCQLIAELFTCHGDGTIQGYESAQKHTFFLHAFNRFTEPDRRWLKKHGWSTYMIPYSQWSKMVGSNPWFLESIPKSSVFGYWLGYMNLLDVKAQAPALRTSNHRLAVIMQMLAMGDNPIAAVDWMMSQHAWHFDWKEPYHAVRTDYWPTFARLYPKKGSYNEILAHLGDKYIAKSPIAIFDSDAAAECIGRSWLASNHDLQRLTRSFTAYSWVPWSTEQRKTAFTSAYDFYKLWVAGLRKEHETLKAKADQKEEEKARIKELQALLTKAPPIDVLFKKVMAPNVHRGVLGPTPLCQQIVQALAAISAKNLQQYLAAARQIYAATKSHAARKVPYSKFALRFIFTNRLKLFDTFDFQVQALAEQLRTLQPNRWNPDLDLIMSGLVSGRAGWLSATPASKKPRVKLVRDLLSAALGQQLDLNQFWPKLFYWLRYTRYGSGWSEYESASDVMTKLIEKKVFYPLNYRPYDSSQSVTTNYGMLVKHEWYALNKDKKFPAKSWFDDLYLEEMKKTGKADRRYPEFAGDYKKKIRQFVVQQYVAGKNYLPGSLWGTWYSRLMSYEEFRKPILDYYDRIYSKTRYDSVAGGREWLDWPHDLSKTDVRKEYFQRVKKYLDRSAIRPIRDWAPVFTPLATIKPDEVTSEELDVLLQLCRVAPMIRGNWRDRHGYSAFYHWIRLVHYGLLAQGRRKDLFEAIPYFWKIARDPATSVPRHEYHRRLLDAIVVELLEKEQFELTAAYSVAGLEIVGPRLPEKLRITLMNGRSKAVSKIGGIPVARRDPRYPLYEAQVAFLAGNLNSAWKLYTDNKKVLETSFTDLDPDFLVWLVERNTELKEFQEAETLGRTLIRWIDSNPQAFDAEVRCKLFVTYANISFAQQEFPRARAQYERILESRDLRHTHAAKEAQIQIAAVERLTHNYEQATLRLEKLAASEDEFLRIGALYQLALIKYDQEEYEEAGKHLDRALMLSPDHADAKILKGELYLKQKKLVEATEIDLGITTAQRVIIPGKPLKVKLEDQNLSIVGKTSNIQIRTWTSSDDEEFFNLYPFGDSKTKFEGTIPTALAAIEKGSAVLEILGNDKVFYDFSDIFKRNHNIVSDAPVSLMVASDGEFQASSGRIPTKKELEEIRLKKLLKITDDSFEINIDRHGRLIRPGNNIFVRVTDLDRCVSQNPNRIDISARTTSGDRIRALPIKETDNTTGIFEGTVKTAPAQPTAFASDSMEGRLPNFCISPKLSYPPWIAVPDSQRPKYFSVDFNDNIALGKMSIQAAVPGRAIKEFYIQTSFNNKSFTTLGGWPKQYKPWDGSLQFEVTRTTSLLSTGEADYLDWAHRAHKFPKISRPQKTFSLSLLSSSTFHSDPQVRNLKLFGSADGYYVARVRGAFFQPKFQRRTFMLKAASLSKGASIRLLVDGTEARSSLTRPMQLTIALEKGAHVIELIAQGIYSARAELQLYYDIDQEPFMAPVPGEFFNIRNEEILKENPQVAKRFAPEMAEITPADDGKKFDLVFPKDARARIVRIMILDYETDAPAINRLSLVDRGGKPILPTLNDFMDLMKNDTLEIIPGDRITLRYTDPKHISRGLDKHEQFLYASYHNANVSACFVEYTEGGGYRQAAYIPIVRFKTGEPIVVLINDPDADTTPGLDRVDFTVATTGKEPIKLQAIETEENSATFTCRLFPIEGEPQRKTDLKIAEGDGVEFSYFDRENTSPGIPWERKTRIRQTYWQDPELRTWNVQSIVVPRKGEDTDEQQPARALIVTRPEEPTDIVTAPARSEAEQGNETEKPPEDKNETEKPPEDKVEKVDKEDPSDPTIAYMDGPIFAEILWPTVALSPRSKISMYAQTSTGLEGHQGTTEQKFDISVPGTIKLTRTASGAGGGGGSKMYEQVLMRSNIKGDALEEGIFSFGIPIKLGDTPEYSPAKEEEAGAEVDKEVRNTLKVLGGDTVYVGFRYEDPEGQKHWLTGQFFLQSDYAFRVLNRKYEEAVTGMHVGETIYFQVFDKMHDTTSDRDEVPIELTTSTGHTLTLMLKETFEHTGEFRGLVTPIYAEKNKPIQPGKLSVSYGDRLVAAYRRPTTTEAEKADPIPDDIIHAYHNYQLKVDRNYISPGGKIKDAIIDFRNLIIKRFPPENPEDASEAAATFKLIYKGLSDRYGEATAMHKEQEEDEIPLAERKRYTPGIKWSQTSAITRTVNVHKGADGSILSFTKRFRDEEIAVQTQFTIAEAYFELAKKHRKLGQKELARKEIQLGKRLLEEAIRDFPHTETKAQADYLLANLSLEFANEATDPKAKQRFYTEALNRFSDIVATSPGSDYAPKAQYKKALTFEKMGLIDRACEEYVKLSYRYPSNQLVAETIARLGQYFWTKGRGFKKQSLRMEDELNKAKLMKQSKDMFRTSGEVFGRLAARFPGHKLAGKTMVLSGQAYIQAESLTKSIEILDEAVKKFEGDKNICPEAMYWLADCYTRRSKKDDMINAYRTFKKLTWDFPASKWAKYARGRLTDDAMAGIESQALEGEQ